MGHITHLRNSSNQKAHLRKAMIKLIKKEKNFISFLIELKSLIMEKLKFPSPRLDELDPEILGKDFFNLQCIVAISLLSPLEKG